MTLSIQLVRSATVKVRVNGFTLLVDPYLAAQGEGRSYTGRERSPLVPLPMPVDEVLSDVDAVFVSHLHSDHFDDAARQLLRKDMPLLCPAPLVSELAGMGFTDVTGIEATLERPQFSLEMTGGRHGPDAVLAEMGDVYGFVLRAAGHDPLYWVGDSIYCPEVQQAIRSARPSTIVVHACGADWHGEEPLVMDCEMVGQMMEDAPGTQVIATHMDTVDHATVTRAELVAYFSRHPGLAARLLIPQDGEVIDVC